MRWGEKIALLACILLTYAIAELFIFNSFTGNRNLHINIDDGALHDCTLDNDGVAIATSDDPWIEIGGIAAYAKSLVIRINDSDRLTQFQVFANYRENPGYGNGASELYLINKGAPTEITIPLDAGRLVDSLRIDFSNQAGSSIHFKKSIAMNIVVPIYIPLNRVLLFISIFSIIAYYLLFPVTNKVEKKSIVIDLSSANRKEYSKPGIVFCIIIVLFLLGVGLEINRSSIGCWQSVFSSNSTIDVTTLIGHPLPIRTDEWMVGTPWTAAQCSEKFPIINRNISYSGQNMLITGTPVLHPVLLFQPSNWGFILFGFNRGLSWSWMFQAALLFLTSYELIRLLTDRRSDISVLFALVIVLAPPVQWWSGLAFIAYMQMGVVGFIHYFMADRVRGRIGWGWVTITGYGALFFTLYPPFVIPAFFLSLCLIVVLFIEQKLYRKLRIIDAVIIPIAILWFCATVYLYFRDMSDAYALITGTVYPGKRVSVGRDTSMQYLVNFLINPFLRFKSPPFMNQSELSSFIPFFIPAVAYFAIRRRARPSSIILIVFIALSCIYMFYGVPEWLAKVTLLSMVPGTRLFVIVGLAGVYLGALALAQILDDNESGLSKMDDYLGTRIVQGVLSSTVLLWLLKSSLEPNFWAYTKYLVPLSAIGFSICFATMIFAMPRAFSALVLASSVFMGTLVNPISIGSAPLTKSALAEQIKMIESNTGSDDLWLTTEGQAFSALLYANGAHTLGGILYYPDMSLWSKLDPQGLYEDVYNRYAHVSFTVSPGPTTFTLVQGDAFRVSVDPGVLKELGVRRILTRQDPNYFLSLGLKIREIYFDVLAGTHILEIL